MTRKASISIPSVQATLGAIVFASVSFGHFDVASAFSPPIPATRISHQQGAFVPSLRRSRPEAPRYRSTFPLKMVVTEPPVKEKTKQEDLTKRRKIREIEAAQDTTSLNPQVAGPIQTREVEKKEEESNTAEIVALGAWLTALSSFIFTNNFVGPWPGFMESVPREVWGYSHAIAAMLFGGGIILTTAFEWIVASTKSKEVLNFYFEKVPILDAMIVLPALTVSMISGTGLSIVKYDGLGLAPAHVQYTLWCLTAFASWWAVTDLSTQGSAMKAIEEWSASSDEDDKEVPKVIGFRRFSNLVSCGFVLALFYIMVVKPGFN